MAQPGNPPPTPGDGQILVYDAAIGGVIVCTASTLGGKVMPLQDGAIKERS